jgi:hypothetical protein
MRLFRFLALQPLTGKRASLIHQKTKTRTKFLTLPMRTKIITAFLIQEKILIIMGYLIFPKTSIKMASWLLMAMPYRLAAIMQ